MRRAQLLPENISLPAATNRRKIHREEESQGEAWAKDKLEGQENFRKHRGCQKLHDQVPSPPSMLQGKENKGSHTRGHSLMLRCLLEVMLSQEKQGHQHKSGKRKAEEPTCIISEELLFGVGVGHPETKESSCYPDTHFQMHGLRDRGQIHTELGMQRLRSFTCKSKSSAGYLLLSSSDH